MSETEYFELPKNDEDYDVRYSTMKAGGYRWAGAWIDPSVPPVVREHPTMSVDESNKRLRVFNSDAKKWKLGERLRQMAEGDRL